MSEFQPSTAKRPRYDEGDEIPVEERELYGQEEENEEAVYESKHTLDSDEEEEVKYKKLDMSKVEGQEDAGEEAEGEPTIMPFNMKEDLEEGHFDADGNFIYDKKEREIKDAWLDNIDWGMIKNAAGSQWNKTDDDGDDSNVKEMTNSELKAAYEKIASVLKPTETIEKALRRLGKQKGISAAEERKRRWAAKKAGTEYVDEGQAAMKELTGLADSLVSRGEMEAYQYTFEQIQHLLRQMDHKAVDDLDIFSDAPTSTSNQDQDKKDTERAESGSDSEVMWEYKMSDEDSAELIGPVSSGDMFKMQEEGKFAEGGFARKAGTQAFYNIGRLDFEIYM